MILDGRYLLGTLAGCSKSDLDSDGLYAMSERAVAFKRIMNAHLNTTLAPLTRSEHQLLAVLSPVL